MPDLAWNKLTWNGQYDWQGRGEEWSRKVWGSSEAQWFGSLYPRLHRFLPAASVLEIAPGFGRWTHFLLKDTRSHYLGVDIAEEAIHYCRDAFRQHPHARFEVNDGRHLVAAEESAYDLVFSFDSLVHAELDVLGGYIPEILLKLRPTGVAFIHHSNWAESPESGEPLHYRAASGSASAVDELIRQAGGHVMIQECISWGKGRLIDCLTLFCRSDASAKPGTYRFENTAFMEEARLIRETQLPYCFSPSTGADKNAGV